MKDQALELLALETRIVMGMIGKLMRQAMEQQLTAEGVNIGGLQFGILRLLELEGDHTISELSRKFMCDPSTLVPSIDTLERRGFVCRVRDASDRRRVPIHLTAEGKQVIGRFDVIHDDDPLLNSLRQMGQPAARHLLTLLHDLLRAMPEGSSMSQHVHDRMQSSIAALTTTPEED
ncbi:MAG: MarR family transcriptional regulator [Anaerolineae bacterium]|nr:MarR family transcriptional regulator [Anaerolineae bacterium]